MRETTPGFMELKTIRPYDNNRANRDRYNITALFYDLLDSPWELQYRKWRPGLVGDLRGDVLEAGVGTGRNIGHYHPSVNLTAMDFSPAMLSRAAKRARNARCRVNFILEDACRMESIASASYDWIVATFLCCVLPEDLQHIALKEFARVLKPGGRFRLLEMIYSRHRAVRRRQDFFTPFVEKVYGARFDRNTLRYIQETAGLRLHTIRFLKLDTYLLIEGTREG
jgi:ubiquinone/menaquinone biosynthesis C-methylase UbiE